MVNTRWEYLVKKNISEDKLIELGEKGWELISHTWICNGRTLEHEKYIFKAKL
jgi:hypothetical protein